MNVDSMHNSITIVSHLSAEQHPSDNYQQEKNLTQNHTNSEDNIKVANEVQASRNTPTTLYISLSFLLSHPNQYNVSLGSIHVGQDTEMQYLCVQLFCSQV